MRWSDGVTWAVRCFEVDRDTWADMREIGITGGTIDRQADGTVESADLDLAEELDAETLVRVYLDAKQDADSERVALFTGLATSPSRETGAGEDTYTAECAGVLQMPSDVLLDLGWFAPAGVSAANYAARLVRLFGLRVEVADGSPALADYVVAEDGDTNLSMAWELLEAAGWTVTVDGCGVVSIKPAETETALRLDALSNDIIAPTVTDERDLWSVPNCLRVTNEDETVEVRDEDEESELSTVRRGREVWASESSVSLADDETLEGYARRELAALQRTVRSLSYSRRFDPDTRPGSIIKIAYPGAGLTGTYRITTQRLDLNSPMTIEEEVESC